MIRLIILTVATFALISALSGCTKNQNNNIEKPRVAVSFYVLEEFTKQIGDDYIDVIAPPNFSGGHNYSPTPKALAEFYSADMFIMQGHSFDPWAEKLIPDLQNKDIMILEVSAELPLMEIDSADVVEDSGVHVEFDPHTWLDPVLAIETVNVIENNLAELDPENSAAYQSNAEAYVSKIAQLDSRFKKELATCELDTIIVAHDAFNYLAERYNIKVESIAGFSPDAKPSARDIAGLSDLASTKGIKHVFFEPMTSPEFSETLASDIGANTLVLDPIEGVSLEDVENGRDYISIMETNLSNLKTAMRCE